MTIRVSGSTPGLEIRRDSAVVNTAQWSAAIPADSGSHLIAASAPGFKTWQSTVSLKDGATEVVVVPALEKAPAARPEAKPVVAASSTSGTAPKEEAKTGGLGTQRALAIGAMGIGVAGVAIGTVFGLKSMAAHDDSQASGVCTGASCQTQDGVARSDDAQRFGNVSTVAFIVGAAGLVGGAVLWFTAGRDTPQVGVGMGNLQLRATW
jgi:hypothetical protein